MLTSFTFDDAREIALSPYTLSLSYSVRLRSDGQWAVVQLACFIDKNGEKDAYEDVVSLWPTQFEAQAEANRLGGGISARKAA